MRLIFATGNVHKFNEIRKIFGDEYKNLIFSSKDFGITIEPAETGKSYEENADIKVKTIYDELLKAKKLKVGDFVISDDTGLSIDYLDGAPGINSARFMGKETDQMSKNMKILDMMKDVKDNERTAYFTTVLGVIKHDGRNCKAMEQIKILHFEGRIDGYIVKEIDKTDGFGYDPIFAVGKTSDMYGGNVKTFSNLGQDGKNNISHRSIALKKFIAYLKMENDGRHKE